MELTNRPAALNGPVADVASVDVVKIDRGTSLRDVAAKLADSSVGLVVVVDGGSVAGVVSERDIVLAVAEGADLDEIRAEDVMSTDLLAVDGRDDIGRAGRIMLDSAVRHLLVSGTDGGVISIRDVLAAALN